MGDGIERVVNGWNLCHPHPFLGLRLFRHRMFSAATASALCNYMVCRTIYYI